MAAQMRDDAQRALDALRQSTAAPIRILDAGCGRRSGIDFNDAHVTGVDVSAEALELNRRLDDRVLGDIQEVELEGERYDAVLCWYVLEHVPEPAAALRNFAHALRPDGLLILSVPNLSSAKGVFTKLTPHRFHIWWYRRVKGAPHAGQPGFGPFRVYLRPVLRPRRLRRVLSNLQFDVEAVNLYEMAQIGEMKRPLVRAGWQAMSLFLRGVTAGRFEPDRTEMLVIAKKRPSAPAA